jgi:hypothetical protein
MLQLIPHSTRTWLGRIVLALAIGVGVGFVGYLSARGVAGVVLLGQQRDVLGSISGFSLDAPPAADLRALRQELQAIEASYQQISVSIGLIIGVIVAITGYLRLEREYDH